MNIPVIVYGTLKRGYPNYDEFRLARFFQGEVATLEAYPLCVAGPWYSPVVFDEPGTGVSFHGELLFVDEATLTWLDQLEGLGQPGGYHRRQITVSSETIPATNAWCYMKHRANVSPVHLQDLDCYLDRRYIPRHKRT